MAGFLSGLKRIIGKTKASFRDYDIAQEILNNKWAKTPNPAAEAVNWYRKTIIPDTKLHFKAKLMLQGHLYIFDYDNPKYEDVLDFFDTQPLVLSLGSVKTEQGWRDIGINMHHLPPRIRTHVMISIFERYRRVYGKDIYDKNQSPAPVKWKEIAGPLFEMGIGFAVRMYIPERRKNVIEFKYEHWKDAIYIPSKGYKRITLEQLQLKWSEFVHKQHLRLNEHWART